MSIETIESIESEFLVLLGRVQRGSEEAAWDLIQKFGPQILRVVRRRLPDVLRRKFDSQDFVQAAWASVFAHRSRLVRFTKSEQFVAYMATVAGNKVAMEVRKRLQGKKYNVQRERPLLDNGEERNAGVNGQQPSPSQVAVAKETWQQLLADQPSHYRRIVELRYTGVSYREIADQLGFDESTVRRAIRKILREQNL